MCTSLGLQTLARAFGLVVIPLVVLASTSVVLWLAGLALAGLLVVMLPANVRAARAHVVFDGKPATALAPRTIIQLLFIAAALSVAA